MAPDVTGASREASADECLKKHQTYVNTIDPFHYSARLFTASPAAVPNAHRSPDSLGQRATKSATASTVWTLDSSPTPTHDSTNHDWSATVAKSIHDRPGHITCHTVTPGISPRYKNKGS